MSPFVAALLGGLCGGIATGVILSLFLMLFGRRLAEGLVEHQLRELEARFKETVVDVALSRIASFLDQSERIGQIAKRVVEIVQLLMRRSDEGQVLEGLAAMASPRPKDP